MRARRLRDARAARRRRLLQPLRLRRRLSLRLRLRRRLRRLQVLQRLMGQVQLVLLHDALLHYALLHFDVLVHRQLVDRVQRGGGLRGVRGREALALHLRRLERVVQPLDGEGALAEVVHGCGGAGWPSRATLASTDWLQRLASATRALARALLSLGGDPRTLTSTN